MKFISMSLVLAFFQFVVGCTTTNTFTGPVPDQFNNPSGQCRFYCQQNAQVDVTDPATGECRCQSLK